MESSVTIPVGLYDNLKSAYDNFHRDKHKVIFFQPFGNRVEFYNQQEALKEIAEINAKQKEHIEYLENELRKIEVERHDKSIREGYLNEEQLIAKLKQERMERIRKNQFRFLQSVYPILRFLVGVGFGFIFGAIIHSLCH